MDGKLLAINTFNIKGFKPRNYCYAKQLFKDADILFLQETWLYEFETQVIGDVLGECQCH